MVFYIKAVEIKSKIVKIKLFCIVLCLCVFMACEKYEPVISDEPVIPPTDQPKEPQEPISTDGIINWNNEFIIVGDNNMANIGSNDWNAVTYGNGRYVTVGDSKPALLMESIGQQPQDLMTYREFVMEMESLLQWEREEMFVIQMTGAAGQQLLYRERQI